MAKENNLIIISKQTQKSQTTEMNDEHDGPVTMETFCPAINTIQGNIIPCCGNLDQNEKTKPKTLSSNLPKLYLQDKQLRIQNSCVGDMKQISKTESFNDKHSHILGKYGVHERQGSCTYIPKYLTDESEDESDSSTHILDHEDSKTMFGELSKFISVKTLKSVIKDKKTKMDDLLDYEMDGQEIDIDNICGTEDVSYKRTNRTTKSTVDNECSSDDRENSISNKNKMCLPIASGGNTGHSEIELNQKMLHISRTR